MRNRLVQKNKQMINKTILILILIGFQTISLQSQLFISDCSADDTVLTRFDEAAHLLAYYEISNDLLENIDLTNDINLPQDWVNTYQEALVAIYNVTELEVIDTLFDYYQADTFQHGFLNRIEIGVSNSVNWIDGLINNNGLTNYVPFDSLINTHTMTVCESDEFQSLGIYMINLCYDDYLNPLALSIPFNNLEEIEFAGTSSFIESDFFIKGKLNFDNSVELVFIQGYVGSFGPSQKWAFTVYPDCSVEYKGTTITNIPTIKNELQLYPNPFQSMINIQGNISQYSYKIYDVNGILVKEGKNESQAYINTDGLKHGIYFIEIETKYKSIRQKMIKGLG